MSDNPLHQKVLEALRQVQDPDLGRDIVALGFIKDLKSCGNDVSFSIELTTPACPVRDQLKDQARRAVLTSIPEVENVTVTMTAQVRQGLGPRPDQILPDVKNVIPVASGKGGVGKSTVAVNLALALARLGSRVGLLDADIYGPSVPHIIGIEDPPSQGPGGRLQPPAIHSVKVISMAFFQPPEEATILRGPMLGKMLQQFLVQVDWGPLDYLMVDLPPGTGDVQLSLCQMIPLTGAVVVSTPQDVALNIAEKAIFMFRKLNTPVLGLVENMSGYTCSSCGNHEDIFGEGGAQRYSMKAGLPFLGAIPLSREVRTLSDTGKPVVLSAPDSAPARGFFKAAENMAAQVSVLSMGEGVSDQPIPKEITQPGPAHLRILWSDQREDLYSWRDLRINCACAACVSEDTGQRTLDPASIPEDIQGLQTRPVGRYALQVQFSDGHSTGIYTYKHLRRLSQGVAEAAGAAAS